MNLYPKTLIIFASMAVSFTTCYATNHPETETEQVGTGTTALSYSSPKVPESVMFCGKKIDLTRFDRHERMDRELLAFAYMHSTSLQTIKRANRYFPIVEPILKEYGIPDDFKYLMAIAIAVRWHVLMPEHPDCGNSCKLPVENMDWK